MSGLTPRRGHAQSRPQCLLSARSGDQPSLPATETSRHRVVRRGASVRTEVPGGCLLGIAVKWLWLGNQR